MSLEREIGGTFVGCERGIRSVRHAGGGWVVGYGVCWRS
jgi:hypothetical protein